MLYYYFGSKEGLYVAVLERAYVGIRSLEQSLDVEHLDPAGPCAPLAELTFDHHESHPASSGWSASRTSTTPSTWRTSPVLPGLADPALDVLTRDPRARARRRACSAPTSTRSTCT